MSIRRCIKCGFILDCKPGLKEINDIYLNELQEWLTQYVTENRINEKYDCNVGVSGGKDSHVMINLLTEENKVEENLEGEPAASGFRRVN